MHKIFDLKEMDIEQLRSLASDLEVKGFKRMEKDDLVYAILDEEARKNALNAPDKPERPRRGRPRKTDKQPAAVKPEETSEQKKDTPALPEEKKEFKKEETTERAKETPAIEQKPQPKKRGRKPKADKEAAASKETQEEEVDES